MCEFLACILPTFSLWAENHTMMICLHLTDPFDRRFDEKLTGLAKNKCPQKLIGLV